MSSPLFVVPLTDLDSGPIQLDSEVPVEWLKVIFADTEAVPRAPGHLSVCLSRSGLEVLVRGRIKSGVVLPCARTLDPVDVDLDAEVLLLLSPKPSPRPPHGSAGGGDRLPHRPPRNRERVNSAMQAVSQLKASKADRKDCFISEEDAAEDSFEGEKIVLDGFLREFLLLELPLMPLRSDLHSDERPAIPRSPSPDRSADAETLDPRLRPLAELARRLKGESKE